MALLHHDASDRLTGEEDPFQIEIDEVVPIGLCHLHGGFRNIRPCIRNQDVDATERSSQPRVSEFESL